MQRLPLSVVLTGSVHGIGKKQRSSIWQNQSIAVLVKRIRVMRNFQIAVPAGCVFPPESTEPTNLTFVEYRMFVFTHTV